jgi:HEPN domain-containing protein
MNVPPEVLEVLAQWVQKAEHDLEAANRILALEDGCPFDTVCFHCQQVAEKYLKCLLTFRGIAAPRTHDLRALALLLPEDARLPMGSERLAELNPYAVQVRYAGDWPEPMLSDAHRALELATAVRQAARELLPAETKTPTS